MPTARGSPSRCVDPCDPGSVDVEPDIDDLRTPHLGTPPEDAYEKAGIGPEEVDFAEVHDCFSIAEVLRVEGLGLFEQGELPVGRRAGRGRHRREAADQPERWTDWQRATLWAAPASHRWWNWSGNCAVRLATARSRAHELVSPTAGEARPSASKELRARFRS